MNLSSYITVFSNILKNLLYVKSDFTGIKFDQGLFAYFILNILITTLLITVYCQVGKKTRSVFLKDNNYKEFTIFVDVALGYIVVNSGLGILGIFSLIYPAILWTYIGLILSIAFYPIHQSNYLKNELGSLLNSTKKRMSGNKWVFLGVCLFVVIAFLRLIPPEIGEDAIGYHTDDPHLFLRNHTTLLSNSYVALPAPHLGEMSYAISEFVGLRDSARYIHFSFYVLVVFLLALINPYAALFFVTAPVVIQISSKANVDFQWILCWLLSIFLISKNELRRTKGTILTGALVGGVLASKLWTIAFFPLFILYLLIHYRKYSLFNKLYVVFIFSLSAFLVDFIWLWRSYIITGSPIYPVPLNIVNPDGVSGILSASYVIGFNKLMFNLKNIGVFSPLFFLGIAVLLLHWRYTFNLLRRSRFSLFFVFLATEYLFIRYHFGRYLLGLYSVAVLVIAACTSDLVKKFNLYKIIFIVIFAIMFIYYFVNTLLILPYGFGWADSNKYLTRIIFRDNTNYYNFDHAFDKLILNRDRVATYGIYGYYYANFDYIDINYIFDINNKSFDLLFKKNVTKLLIKGGDIIWFCKTVSLYGCNSNKVRLLASYPKGNGKFNLYNLIKSY